MKSVKKAPAAKTSSKTKASAVKKAAASPLAPPATDCEKLKEPKAGIRGEYYFLVKIVPKAKPEPIRTRFVGTIHYTDEQSAAAKKTGLELQVMPTTRQSLNKYRFEIQDLNSKLDDMKQAECALDSQDGVAWRSNADDYIILKAVIR